MKGIVFTNAYFTAPPYLQQVARITEELRQLGAEVEVCRGDAFPALIDGNIRLHGKLDFCVFLDKDKYAAQMLEKCGVRLFNSASAINACDDKMLTFIKLAGSGIPMPKTIPAPLCYRPEAVISEPSVLAVERNLGYPIVVKTAYGSMGKGVYLAQTRAELLSLMTELKLVPHLYQEFIAHSAGKDLRVIVVGGKALGGMLREGSDFRSNVGAGGVGKPFTLDAQATQLAEQISRLLCLDFCGIDLLFTPNGYLLCEVNSNAFFSEFERVTHINVASTYAKHILESM